MSSALATRQTSVLADDFIRDLARDLDEAIDPVELGMKVGIDFDPWQKTVLRTPKRQSIVLCSRQAGKSTIIALKAIHVAINEPGSIILVVSPGERQSTLLFKKIKAFYNSLGRPVSATKDNELSLVLSNGSEIYALPGNEDTVRGFSAVRLIVCDEASQVREGLYLAVRPMLAVSGGEVILLSTPFGKRGFFYDTWIAADTHGSWEKVGPIDAYQIPRISAEFLAEEKRALPALWFAQEYLCQFLDQVDQVFSMDQIASALSDLSVTPLFGGTASSPLLVDGLTPLLSM